MVNSTMRVVLVVLAVMGHGTEGFSPLVSSPSIGRKQVVPSISQLGMGGTRRPGPPGPPPPGSRGPPGGYAPGGGYAPDRGMPPGGLAPPGGPPHQQHQQQMSQMQQIQPKHILYDEPVSNNGARCRMILYKVRDDSISMT